MANYVLKDATLWWEGYDLSGKLTQMSLPLTQDVKEDTTMGDSNRTFVPGWKGGSLAYSGYHDNATVLDPDKYIFAERGSVDTIVTVSCDGADEGEKAYSLYVNTAEYTPVDGETGDMAGFSLNATATGKDFQGIVMQNGQETITGTGTAREILGMDEDDVAYMVIHCTELDATTLDITVTNDTVVTMDDDPTARDFGQVQFTAIGAQYLTFTAPSGITTYDCWRIGYTLAGGNTTATIVVNLYIP